MGADAATQSAPTISGVHVDQGKGADVVTSLELVLVSA